MHLQHRMIRLRWLALALLLTVTPATAQQGELLTGAGAHSSWVVFDKLKPVLEKSGDYSLKLFGKQSMLGVGCNAGIKSVMQYSAKQETFGFVCCKLDDEEVRKKNLQVFPLALEPLMILSHEENPVNNLSINQIRDIFSGKITNWKDVGGNDQAIVVVTRLHCKKRPGHWKRILPSPDSFTGKRINVQSADEMVKRVGDFKAAIGHAGTAWLRGDNSRTKIITVDGYMPTVKNLQAGSYPFYRELSAIIDKNASDKLKNLMRTAQQEMLTTRAFTEHQLAPHFSLKK